MLLYMMPDLFAADAMLTDPRRRAGKMVLCIAAKDARYPSCAALSTICCRTTAAKSGPACYPGFACQGLFQLLLTHVLCLGDSSCNGCLPCSANWERHTGLSANPCRLHHACGRVYLQVVSLTMTGSGVSACAGAASRYAKASAL